VAPAEAPALVEPTWLWVPDHVGTYGDEALDLCRMAGMRLDPEQELAVNLAMIHDAKGNWVASEVGIVEPRQNGKTSHVVVPMTLADLFLFPPDLVMHTAHRFKTTSRTFGQIKTLIDGCYELRRRVKKILEGHGNESIELHSGAELVVLARSDSGGRGLGGKRIDLDEAFALKSGQIGAILPTLLARPNTQIVYASSAGMATSDALREVRDRGRAGNDPGLVWIEWCAPGSWEAPGCASPRCNHHRTTRGCALDDPVNHARANPALNRRIRETSIAKMRRGLTPLEFGREILGWWDDPVADDVVPIKIADWDRCADPGSTVVGAVTLSFDVAPDRRTAAVAVAGHREDGILHGELVRYATGTDWVVGEILDLISRHELRDIIVGKERRRAIVCDPAGPAGSLIPDLEAAGVRVVSMSTRMMGTACGQLQDAVAKGPTSWRHLGQTQVDLAVEGASRRDIGDGQWAFGRKRSAAASVDICPLVAVAVARWALTVAAPPVVMPRAAWA